MDRLITPVLPYRNTLAFYDKLRSQVSAQEPIGLPMFPMRFYMAYQVFTGPETCSTALLKKAYVALPCILITLYHIETHSDATALDISTHEV